MSRGRPSGRGARAGGTVERILDAALELLNGESGAEVTTNHIAAHLGMSPGNLYYHFRNREEIVRAIFPRLAEDGLRATAAPGSGALTAEELGARHLQGLHMLWRYRFFFRDLNRLLARDPALAELYRDYERRLRTQYRGLFELLIAQRSMRAPEPADEIERLVTASILLWSHWIPHLMAVRGRTEITRRDVVEGALHSFLLIAPLLETRFAIEARDVIERHGRRRDG